MSAPLNNHGLQFETLKAAASNQVNVILKHRLLSTFQFSQTHEESRRKLFAFFRVSLFVSHKRFVVIIQVRTGHNIAIEQRGFVEESEQSEQPS